jgi:hypothetical protein
MRAVTASLLVSLALAAHLSHAASSESGSPRPAAAPRLDAYVFPNSVAQGDSVRIYVSTDAPTFDLRIFRDAPTPSTQLAINGISGRNQTVPAKSWEAGCGWSPTVAFAVPQGWPSGVYFCEMTVGGAVAGRALFTLRERVPGSTATVLFQNSIATWQAYNAWGGKSLYDFNSSDSVRAASVSMQRPYAQHGTGLGDYTDFEQPLVHWLASQGIAVEFCTDLDVHADSTLLGAYALLLVVGHDEYWSWEQRHHVEQFVAHGGNVGIFGGNTCWMQIRVSSAGDRVICYKDKSLDPLTGIDNKRVTVTWAADPVLRPENPLTGVSWRKGGFVNAFGWFPAAQGYGGYTAYDTDHWVFAGTGLRDGQVFGQAAAIVGYEVDGALLGWIRGVPFVTGGDATPVSYCILGLAPASWGYATMGIYTQGGTVFNAATTNWTHGLAADPIVARITRNVLDRLGTRSAASGSPQLRLAAMPNPAGDRVRLDWQGELGGPAELVVYAADGRRVTALKVLSGQVAGSVLWNGADSRGRRVANGIYMARLRGPRGSAAAKVLLMR